MEEIYISWDDSVRIAIGLYDEILRKKADGVYERRNKLRGIALDAAVKLDSAAKALREAGHNFREGMMENFSGRLFK